MDTASVNDTERYFILDLNAIHMLKYRTREKIDWAFHAFFICSLPGPKAGWAGTVHPMGPVSKNARVT